MVATECNTTCTFPNAVTINLLTIVGNSPSKVTHLSAQMPGSNKIIKNKTRSFLKFRKASVRNLVPFSLHVFPVWVWSATWIYPWKHIMAGRRIRPSYREILVLWRGGICTKHHPILVFHFLCWFFCHLVRGTSGL